MAWIEQTKKGLIKSGGPQYYLQDLSETSRDLLRMRQRCPVRLWTPYGIVDSGLTAVSCAVGSVGHDRVQSGHRVRSVADQIAHWYCLNRNDIETIEFSDSFDREAFVICPTYVRFFGRRRNRTLHKDVHPLSVFSGHHSALIEENIAVARRRDRRLTEWAASQLDEIVGDHNPGVSDLDERDLLRTSGALHLLGIRLGRYRAKGIDCPEGKIRLCGYPDYPCQIEIEERSSGFLAEHHARHRSQRALILCMRHDAREVVAEYVDVVELCEFAKLLREVA
jgi:hypothetical protein